MKILTDFDGTLTDIQHEYDFELHHIQQSLSEQFDISSDEFDLLYQTTLDVIRQNPCRYGWFNNSRISAFSDEDLFMYAAAVMTQLDQWFDNPPASLRHIIQKLPSPQFMRITEDAHAAMNLQPLCAHNTPEPLVVETFNQLLKNGHEIVVASNSPASRIIPKFEFVGLHPVDHDAAPDAQFRIRGNACKFVLGNTPDPVDFGPRTIDVDRPEFRRIIEQEAPDIAIGDVFSLDIALPAAMSVQNPALQNIRLILRQRSYTPQWAVHCLQAPELNSSAHYTLLSDFTQLASITS